MYNGYNINNRVDWGEISARKIQKYQQWAGIGTINLVIYQILNFNQHVLLLF